MESLTKSVKAHGILQPLVVRLAPDSLELEPQYRIVFGERRWRAAREAELTEVPVIMRDDLNDADAFELALTENINRDDLTVLEECDGLLELVKLRGYTEETRKYAYGKVYNAEAYSACSNMPRFGAHGILTEQQIKDVVALLLDPKSPVNQ